MSKLRLDYFLSIGGFLSDGDVYTTADGASLKTIDGEAIYVDNIIQDGDDKRFIESLAWRENTGEQGCISEMPIVYVDSEGQHLSGLSCNRYWTKTNYYTEVVKWMPELVTLIKMQDVHDKIESPEEKEALDKIDNSITPTADELDLLMQKRTVNAKALLQSGIDLIDQRGAEYDKNGAERSFEAVAICFNAKTGKDITAAEVCLLLQDLKDVRQWSDDRLHEDSVIDCVNYAALKGEELHKQYSK